MKIAVIGGGIAGLAAAIRVRSLGHEVTIYEKNGWLGGKLSTLKQNGFTWDGGPSFFTDPDALNAVFADAGEKPEDYFTYDRLDEACRYFYKDKTIHGWADQDRFAAEIEAAFDEKSGSVRAFLADAQKAYEGVGAVYMNSPITFKSMARFSTLKQLILSPKNLLFHTMHTVHTGYFKSPEVQAFFDRFATYNGSSPYKAPGMLSAIPTLEHTYGAFQPAGGMRAVPRSLERLAKGIGVNIQKSVYIKSIGVGNKTIKYIELEDGNQIKTDIVIAAQDVFEALRSSGQDKKATRHAKREQSASAIVLYLGIKNPPKGLYLHNIFFSDDYAKENDMLWSKKVPALQPTVYLNVTSTRWASDAPKGMQNWFVMVNVPSKLNQNWLEETRKRALVRISEVLNFDIEPHIVTECSALTPDSLSSMYGALSGSIYGLASNSWRGAFLRPPNKSRSVRGLYHVGVTTHPGGGIPLALRSAKIVADMIGKA